MLSVIAWIGTIVVFGAIGCTIEAVENKHKVKRQTKQINELKRCA